MADRKETPDILGGLLGDMKAKTPEEQREDTSKTVKQNTIKTESQNTIKTAKQPTRKPVSQSTSKTEVKTTSKPAKTPTEAPEPSGEKVKATYYIAIEAVEALDEGWLQLRKLSSTDTRTSISKSLIVEEAIQIVLDELKKSGQKSRIAKKIVK